MGFHPAASQPVESAEYTGAENALAIDGIATYHAVQIHAEDNRYHAQHIIEHHVESEGPESAVAEIAHALISKC